MMRKKHPQPEWMASVVVGSVLREGENGPLRVVRKAKRNQDGTLWGVSLAIRRCSWTRRPYTTLCASDLKTRKFRLVPVKPVVLKGDFNARMAASIGHTGFSWQSPMQCCEAVGVP